MHFSFFRLFLLPTAFVLSSLSNQLYSQELLPRPKIDLSFEDPHIRMISGIRPYRKGGIRMERETIGKDIVVWHNYGHGGAGLTLSWGTVEEVLNQAKDDLEKAANIVILGAGVTGLTTAFELARMGFSYRHLAATTTPDTTSNIAGGLWLAASVDLAGDLEPNRSYRILERSYLRYLSLLDTDLPVKKMRYFQFSDDPHNREYVPFSLDDLAERGLLPPVIRYDVLPIEGVISGGKEYQTFLIDTPLYIGSLTEKAMANQAIENNRFASQSELLNYFEPETLIFNCTGLGSSILFQDENLIPVRGQLVLIRRDGESPASDQDFMTGGHGYLFPRQNEWVLGGTHEFDEWDPTPDPKVGRRILRAQQEIFGFLPPGDEE